MGGGYQVIGVRQSAKDRIDFSIIRYVISAVFLRRRIKRTEPNRIDAEVGDVVEARGYSRQIADAITIGICKRARINLIDNCRPPPLFGRLIRKRLGDSGALGFPRGKSFGFFHEPKLIHYLRMGNNERQA